MATVTKDFKIKYGLVVEGTTATVNNFSILTKSTADQDYIVGLIGGTSTSANTADTVVKRDANGDFAAGTITADLVGDVTGNADTATALETSRTIELTGDVTGSIGFDGTSNVQISTTLNGSFATDAEVATAKGEAIADAAADATSKANAAQSAAEATASADATSKANAAQSAAEATASADATSKANAAQSAAEDYADSLASNYDAAGSAAAAQTAAEGFATQAIANLVDSAPATLDTLNELAAALQDNPDIISDLQDIAAGKQDELTAGANIDITGATISVTGLSTDDVAEDAGNLYFTNQRALDATAAAYDVVGSGAGALEQANDYTDGEITTALTTAQGYASTAQDNAQSFATNAINALDTDDIEEGAANQYFTDARAKSSAADLLTGASLTNITITGSGSGLTITAENGVADSDTDDLVEGTTNLYFTDVRAVDALEAVVPDFTAVEISSLAKQVAATLSVPTASSANVAYAFPKATYRSAEFLVKTAYGTHTEVSKVLLTLDTSDNIAITEYGTIGTNGASMTISAGISGANVQLLVTTANNSSTVSVVGTLLA
jgi:hypothetical protein